MPNAVAITVDSPTYDAPPETWAEIARAHVVLEQWDEAARAWSKACQTSAGHNRRARYDEARLVCLKKAKEALHVR